MISKQLTYLGLFLFIILVLLGAYYSLQQRTEQIVQQAEQQAVERAVQRDAAVILVSAPKTVSESSFTVNFELTKSMQSLLLLWKHPATESISERPVESFQAGSKNAQFLIDAEDGFMLPGLNEYQVVGKSLTNNGKLNDVEYRISFQLSFLFDQMPDLNADSIGLERVLTVTGTPEIEILGQVNAPAQIVQLYSYHPDSGKASFAVLQDYSAGDDVFRYVARGYLDNFFVGDNLYVVEFLDAQRTVIARRSFAITSTFESEEDKLEERFGSFAESEGGWFVSEKLPWFSLRLAYSSALLEAMDGKLLLPRPTLLYTALSTLETSFCDFLNGIDYEQEGLSYRGFSYETCQQFRNGVSAYDRFLSSLQTEGLKIIEPVEYKHLSGEVTTAFVMIETGGMRRDDQQISFKESVDSFADGASEDRVRYYIYQMLISEKVPYPEKKIGEIVVEITDERRFEIDELKSYLELNTGDELFSDVLFPEKTQE